MNHSAMTQVTDSTQRVADSVEKVALLPCPFCGPGQSVVDAYDDSHKPSWRVGCGRCGSHSGLHWTKQEAIAAWNRRSLPAQAEREAVIEECARVCDALAAAKWKAYQRTGSPSYCNPSMEAGSDALDEASTAIRALKPSARGSGG